MKRNTLLIISSYWWLLRISFCLSVVGVVVVDGFIGARKFATCRTTTTTTKRGSSGKFHHGKVNFSKKTNNDETVQTLVVDQLLDTIEGEETSKALGLPKDKESGGKIQEFVDRLASSSTCTTTTGTQQQQTKDDVIKIDNNNDNNTDGNLFNDLIGYYNVSYTLTARTNDNPVGGKWTRNQKLWRIKRTMQHVLLPTTTTSTQQKSSNNNNNVVAQVVNAIYLECLWGLIPIWIVLRGDAIPLDQDINNNNNVQEQYKKKKREKLVPNLTKRTVRAYFDKPRIGIGKKFILTFGPTSSVVLDTPYVDNRIRIGVGGTSGTKFVFTRILEDDDDIVAKEGWKWLLDKKPETTMMITKRKATIIMSILGLVSCYGWKVMQGRFRKSLAGTVFALTVTSLGWIISSTGGIETRGDTYTPGKQ